METKQLLQILEELRSRSSEGRITGWILAAMFLDTVKVAIYCRGPDALLCTARD